MKITDKLSTSVFTSLWYKSINRFYVGIYCCAIGPEGTLIQQFFAQNDKLRYALAVKSLCDGSI
ncbi:MAG: hypothetical protein ACTS7I_02375, partial [Candidatus Hodgkinia cicadicola]